MHFHNHDTVIRTFGIFCMSVSSNALYPPKKYIFPCLFILRIFSLHLLPGCLSLILLFFTYHGIGYLCDFQCMHFYSHEVSNYLCNCAPEEWKSQESYQLLFLGESFAFSLIPIPYRQGACQLKSSFCREVLVLSDLQA